MNDINSNIKVWLNDCLLHMKTEDDLLATLNFFLKQGQNYGLKLHASMCVLFASTVRYCGMLITKDGIRFDPRIWKRCRQCTSRRMVPTWYSSKLDSKSHYQLLEACDPSSSSTGEIVRGQKSQDEGSCSLSVAATTLGTRGASGFQRFTSSCHGVNDFGIPRPRLESLCLDGCL
jgi:hypothetical protein